MPSLNYLAVGTATIASFLLNFVWYLLLFASPYREALGKTKEQMDAGPSLLTASVMQFVGTAITVCVLAWLIDRTGATTTAGGLWLALVAWLGFVAAVLAPMYAFQAYGLTFFLITSGSVLVTLLVSGAIVGTWR